MHRGAARWRTADWSLATRSMREVEDGPASRTHAEVDVALHLHAGQGVFDDQRQIASRARRRPRPRADRAGQQRRRVRRQGGHVDPGPNGAHGLARRPAGEAHAHAARKLPASIRSGTRSSSRTRSAAMPKGRITAVQARIIGDKGAYASVGAKVLERAGGHCTGPYRVPSDRHGIARRLHEQSALRRDARLRREPVRVRDRGPARSAGREGRHRRLRHPRPQHPRAGRSVRHRARSSTSRSASARRSKR